MKSFCDLYNNNPTSDYSKAYLNHKIDIFNVCKNVKEYTLDILKYINKSILKDKNKYGNTPLMCICIYNESKYALNIIKYIVSIDINTLKDKNKYGDTPLIYICKFNHSKYALDIIKYIVSIDKNTLNDKDKYRNTPLIYICIYN